MILQKFFLKRDETVLVVVDVQEKLCLAMDQRELDILKSNVHTLLQGAEELGIPVVATEQYPRGLGETLPELKTCLREPALDKMTFSCCGDDKFMKRIEELGRRQIVVAGMETHVCVLQTVLELLEKGYAVHLVNDAVLSRKEANRQTGLEMARSAGAVLSSTETVLFQLLRTAGTEEFKKVSKLVR